jgi:hypothetical protein
MIQYDAMAIRFNSVAEKFEGPVTLIVVSGVDNRFATK